MVPKFEKMLGIWSIKPSRKNDAIKELDFHQVRLPVHSFEVNCCAKRLQGSCFLLQMNVLD